MASTTQASPSFFDLPEKARNNVYKLLLIIPHPLYLFQDSPSLVELFAPEKPSHWTAILHVNRQMNQETSAIVYGENKFHLADLPGRQHSLLQTFFSSIGSSNVRRLTHICINFPTIEAQLGTVRLSEDDLESLRLLQESCTSLRTLEVHTQRRSSRDLDWTDESATKPIEEGSIIYSSGLKAFPALENVIVRIHGGKPTQAVTAAMERLGWVVMPANSNAWS